jgi:hypothetical protein
MPTDAEMHGWPGRRLVGPDGTTIGKIEEIYVDAETERRDWALVRLRRFCVRTAVVPMAEAESTAEGVVVPFSREHVRQAPRIEGGGDLTPREKTALVTHYGDAAPPN